VSDSASAQESLHCMMQLLEFPEDTRVLEFIYSGVDTDNNTYYRFVAKTLDGQYVESSSITVSVGTDGDVLSVSNTCPNRWNQEPEDIRSLVEQAKEYYLRLGHVFLFDEFKIAYDGELCISYWYNYYQDNNTGEIKMVYATKLFGEEYCENLTVADSMEHFDLSKHRGLNESILDQDVVTVNKEFVDYYGNIVNLPCAEKDGKWYLYDKNNRLLGIDNKTGQELYFDEEYFKFVNLYKTNPEEVSKLFQEAYVSDNNKYLTDTIGLAIYIYAFETIQNEMSKATTRRVVESKDDLLVIRYINDPGYPNLSAGLGIESSYLNIYNSVFATQYDVVSHELGHMLNFFVSGYLPPAYATGAIKESYGDILGNLAEMIQETTPGYRDSENWLMGEANGMTFVVDDGRFILRWIESAKTESESVFASYALHMKDNTYIKNGNTTYSRNMSNPQDEGAWGNWSSDGYIGSPSKVGDKYFIENTEVNYSYDRGGIHANSGVLNNVCYNMYQKLHAMDESFGYQQLYNIWFDSMQYNTADTLYSDIATYVKQSMINKNYSSEEINAAMQCFKDANVYAYVPNSVEHIYSTTEKAQSEMCDIQVEEELQVAASSVESNLEQILSNAEEVPTDSVETIEDIREEIADTVDAVEETSETIADAEEAVEEASETITDAEETLVDIECVDIGGM